MPVLLGVLQVTGLVWMQRISRLQGGIANWRIPCDRRR